MVQNTIPRHTWTLVFLIRPHRRTCPHWALIPLGGLISYCIIGPTFLLLDEVCQIRRHGENWGGWGLHCRWELEGNPLDFSFYGMLVMLQCWYNWNCLVCVTVSHRVIVFYRVLGPYGPHLLSLDKRQVVQYSIKGDIPPQNPVTQSTTNFQQTTATQVSGTN